MSTAAEISAWASKTNNQARIAVAARSMLRMLPYAVDGSSHANISWSQEQISLSVLSATITAVSLANSHEPLTQFREHAKALATSFFEGDPAVDLERSQPERDWMHAVQAAHLLASLCYSETPGDFDKMVKKTFWSADWVGDIHEQGPEAYGLAEAEVLRDIWSLDDGEKTPLRGRPLWSKEYRESSLQFREWRLDRSLAGKGTGTDFWRRWYQAFLDGSPMDWELQRRVALGVSDDIWNAGVEAVAQRIAVIEQEYNDMGADKKPEPSRVPHRSEESARGPVTVEPEPLEHGLVEQIVFQPEPARMSMVTLSATISTRMDLFHRMARPNEQIPFIETFQSLHLTATSISDLTKTAKTDEGAKTRLEEEIGKLRAEAELLRAQLNEALSEIEKLKKKPWFKAGSILITTSTIGAIVSGLWILSGDDKRLSERWGNLASDLEFLQQKLWPEGEAIPVEELQYALPESFDA